MEAKGRTMTAIDWPAIGYAAAAALVFAVANNLQRGAASVVPLEVGGPVRLVLRLLTRPRWLLGSTLALAALGLHAVALARGGVILVQAVLATGLIAAVVIEAAQERAWLRGGELGGAVVLVIGVTLLLGWGRPGGGRPVDLTVQVIAAAALAVVAGVGLAASRLHHRVRLSALVMGGAAGACFALDAMFLKGVANWTDDLDAFPAMISLAGFVVASVCGNLIVQRAFQRAPLRLVLPTVTAADPIAAFVVGRLLLHERLEGGAGSGTAVVVGLTAIVVGIALTTTHGRAAVERDRTPGSGTHRTDETDEGDEAEQADCVRHALNVPE
jgi:drug/metabolite transporter (DMT)-like permease